MSEQVPTGALTASVVVVTLSRPDYLRSCLRHLGAQRRPPEATVVVDASPDDRTYRLVQEEFPAVGYLRNPSGAGHTGLSRSLGLAEVSSEVVAFVDDDAYAAPDWLEQLLAPYADPAVGGVGGRVRNNQPGEAEQGLEDIGRLHPDGTLSGNFAADPGHPVEVDHLLGASMSFRREALLAVGGIRDGYPGTCLREETDPAFRVRAAGWRLVYAPLAVVEHVAAPYPRGRRFDIRYTYYAHRNHLVLLARTLGYSSPELRRYLAVAGRESLAQLRRAGQAIGEPGPGGLPATARSAVGGLSRAGATTAGTLVGLGAGYLQRRGDRQAAAG